jgi:hypothetical protein
VWLLRAPATKLRGAPREGPFCFFAEDATLVSRKKRRMHSRFGSETAPACDSTDANSGSVRPVNFLRRGGGSFQNTIAMIWNVQHQFASGEDESNTTENPELAVIANRVRAMK